MTSNPKNPPTSDIKSERVDTLLSYFSKSRLISIETLDKMGEFLYSYGSVYFLSRLYKFVDFNKVRSPSYILL